MRIEEQPPHQQFRGTRCRAPVSCSVPRGSYSSRRKSIDIHDEDAPIAKLHKIEPLFGGRCEYAEAHSPLQELDQWIRRRPRCCRWPQWGCWTPRRGTFGSANCPVAGFHSTRYGGTWQRRTGSAITGRSRGSEAAVWPQKSEGWVQRGFSTDSLSGPDTTWRTMRMIHLRCCTVILVRIAAGSRCRLSWYHHRGCEDFSIRMAFSFSHSVSPVLWSLRIGEEWQDPRSSVVRLPAGSCGVAVR